MNNYVILRNLSAVGTSEPFSFRAARPRAMAVVPMEPEITVERLSVNAVQEVSQDPTVLAVTPRMPTKLIKPFDAQIPSRTTEAWGIEAVGAKDCPFSGEGVTVCVLDTGVDASHRAFAGVSFVQKDFSGSGDGDRQGHGTHCMGTIVGRDVDGIRIGIAPGVKRALIGKVLDDTGSGSSEMIFQGIQWAVSQGADVVSMSLGFDFPGLVKLLSDQGWPIELATSSALEAYRGNLRMFDALMEMVASQAAFTQGTVIVAAAGNESQRDVHPDFEIAASIPAAAEGVISVGALQKVQNGLQVASFSNTFPQVSAPGVGILSAKLGGGLRSLSGTSMACPHVAGVAALWWDALRKSALNANATAVMAKLLASSRTNVFAPDVDFADRGMGLVTAPRELS
ncbi:MAG: peptidase S8 [Geobacteraceae bacterium GWC2_58_44]|nr:MAG: peptidase S8 [Geobacteraceae bacterium GWC2_58_44]HBG04365.1 peptidase S8 [Geobacter sp.]